MLKGRIHSSESFGTVDGPGIRYVLFMQGCPMRCLYCHNPDTWDIHGGSEVTAEDVVDEICKNAAFYKNGGLTVTGGEPLVQIEFVTELFTLASAHGIHTCLDTSGIVYDPSKAEGVARFDRLMEHTDLVMLDIKHIDSNMHRLLTGMSNANVVAFAEYLDKKHVPVWIRHVVIEGYTDDRDHLFELGKFIGSLSNVKALDVLPYHNMGVSKYDALGIDYPLRGVCPLTREKAIEAKQVIMDGIRFERSRGN